MIYKNILFVDNMLLLCYKYIINMHNDNNLEGEQHICDSIISERFIK